MNAKRVYRFEEEHPEIQNPITLDSVLTTHQVMTRPLNWLVARHKEGTAMLVFCVVAGIVGIILLFTRIRVIADELIGDLYYWAVLIVPILISILFMRRFMSAVERMPKPPENQRWREPLSYMIDGEVVTASELPIPRKGFELWALGNFVYSVPDQFTPEEKALIVKRQHEREMALLDGSRIPSRQSIPDHIQVEVFQRYQGRCAKCGSQENLEFDHIIPVSKGGSNTARNIQLLCQSCNREKSNKIGG